MSDHLSVFEGEDVSGGKKPKAYSYLRFSTPEQMKGDSYRRQTKLAEAWASRNGVELDDGLAFHDLGVSAYRSRNSRSGALRHFLDAVEQGALPSGSYLLVESLDRLSRDQILGAQGLFSLIIEAGITLVTLGDERVYSRDSINANPTELIVSILILMRAHEESQTKARRLKAAWAGKREKATTRPLTQRAPGWLRLDKEAGVFHVIPERAEVVRRIFEMALKGAGQHAIARQLNAEGVPCFGRGAFWHRSYIHKTLDNPAVVGTFVPHTLEFVDGKRQRKPQEPVEGYYPAIVDEDSFRRVQAQRLDTRGPVVRQGAKGVTSLFAGGLARCPDCGASMTRVMKGDVKRAGKPKLVCSGARAKAGCSYRSVPLEDVELAMVRGAGLLVAEAPSGDDSLDEMVIETEAAISALEDTAETLAEAISKTGTSPTLAAKLREVENELDEARRGLTDLQARQAIASGPLLRQKLKDLHRALTTEPLDRTMGNVLMRQLFSSVVVNFHKGDLELIWKNGQISHLIYAWPDEVRHPDDE
ncbi:MAG: recombinase family protein [Pseudomonadota bacterium]